jgi:hypothetical protein
MVVKMEEMVAELELIRIKWVVTGIDKVETKMEINPFLFSLGEQGKADFVNQVKEALKKYGGQND